MACGLNAIDWHAPWLSPWRELGQSIAHSVSQGAHVHEACNQHLKHKALTFGCPVQFVAQSHLPEGMAYEQFIFEHKAVPTRDGLHDFFNALCWLHFPLAKQQLNRVQAAAIQAQGVGAVRGPVRDAVTVFDENACLIQVPDEVWHALQLRQWSSAFVTLRHLWQGAQVHIFGHAALEKLVNPYKAIAVHLWRVPCGVPLSEWDAWLAQDLQAEKLAKKPFLPMPVLGVPGWWAENEAPIFYDDTQVFRLPRSA